MAAIYCRLRICFMCDPQWVSKLHKVWTSADISTCSTELLCTSENLKVEYIAQRAATSAWRILISTPRSWQMLHWNNKVTIKKVGLGLDWVEYMLSMLQYVLFCFWCFWPLKSEHREQPRMFLLFFAEGVARVGIQGLCAKWLVS